MATVINLRYFLKLCRNRPRNKNSRSCVEIHLGIRMQTNKSLELCRNTPRNRYSEKYRRISNIQQKPRTFNKDHEFRGSSEFTGHRSSASEISLRKSSFPLAQAGSLDLFLREISRAPFRGNKWLSLLELAARRAKLIGKTHVRTPQVRRLLPKRELVRKGSEKTAKSACPRRHAAPTPQRTPILGAGSKEA